MSGSLTDLNPNHARETLCAIFRCTECADKRGGKHMEPFFSHRCTGTYTITDVTVPLEGRNKPLAVLSPVSKEIQQHLTINQHSKYLEAQVLENQCFPESTINGMNTWLASLQTNLSFY